MSLILEFIIFSALDFFLNHRRVLMLRVVLKDDNQPLYSGYMGVKGRPLTIITYIICQRYRLV